MKKRVFIPLSLCFMLGATPLAHGENTEASTWYKRGKEMFLHGNYVGCEDMLTRYKQYATDAHLIQECDYMMAMAAYVQDTPNALTLLKGYLQAYPGASHVSEVEFAIANYYFFCTNYAEVVRRYEALEIDHLTTPQKEDYLYRLAFSYMQEGELAKAKSLFDTLPSLAPRYAEASQYYWGYIAYLQKNYDEALQVIAPLSIREGEFKRSSNYLYTQIEFERQKYPQVIKRAEALLDQYPNQAENLELHRMLGESYYHQGEDARAIEHLAIYVEESDEPLRETLYIYGVVNYRQAHYNQAIAALSMATDSTDVISQSSYLYLGQTYLKKNDSKSARLAFEQAAHNNVDKQVQEVALYNYALTIHETAYSLFDESVTVFETFLNEFPQSRYADQINNYLVEVYLTTRNYSAALASIAKIKHPTPIVLGAKQRLLFQEGTELFINNKQEEAMHYFTQSIAMGNYDTEAKALAYLWRGEGYYRAGEYAQAEKDYKNFLATTQERRTPNYALGLYNLGYTYFKQHNFVAAEQQFARYVALREVVDKKNLADAYNRLGDSRFSQRDFAQAQNYYAQATAVYPQASDYALFQKGYMSGLQNATRDKIAIMNQLISNYPHSEYVDDALYEKGMSYVQLAEYPEAITAFNTLLGRFPQSSAARKATLQLGIVYYNNDQPSEAIAAYKKVIESYPGSEESHIAADDLKTLYVEQNNIQGYADYIATLNGLITFDSSEQDSLTYLAAERLYLQGRKAEAQKSMASYLQNFPQGAFTISAHYYLGNYALEQENYNQALTHFEAVLQQPDSRFGEDALLSVAQIYTHQEAYEKALKAYQLLEIKTSGSEKRQLARMGILRMQVALHNNDEIILAAGKVLEAKNLSPELEQEARYQRAMTLLSQEEGERALPDLAKLAQEPRSAYGAESAYRQAQFNFDNGAYDLAEEQLNTFIEAGTSHQYWLARAFLTLSDLYVQKGENYLAKQYLLSLKTNYKGNDDIATQIETRLAKIPE